jgi:hypothetical protein
MPDAFENFFSEFGKTQRSTFL